MSLGEYPGRGEESARTGPSSPGSVSLYGPHTSRESVRNRSARTVAAAASAWIRAARAVPRLVTQLASTAVPAVSAATHKALSAIDSPRESDTGNAARGRVRRGWHRHSGVGWSTGSA